jgi:hypothetical protein
MNQTLYLVQQNAEDEAITYHCVIPDIFNYYSGSDTVGVKITLIIQSGKITSLRVTRELWNNENYKINNHIIGYITTESLLFKGLVGEIQSQPIVLSIGSN